MVLCCGCTIMTTKCDDVMAEMEEMRHHKHLPGRAQWEHVQYPVVVFTVRRLLPAASCQPGAQPKIIGGISFDITVASNDTLCFFHYAPWCDEKNLQNRRLISAIQPFAGIIIHPLFFAKSK